MRIAAGPADSANAKLVAGADAKIRAGPRQRPAAARCHRRAQGKRAGDDRRRRRSCHPAEHDRQFAGLAGCRHSAQECDGADRSRAQPRRADRMPKTSKPAKSARAPRVPRAPRARKAPKRAKSAKGAKTTKSDDADDTDDTGKLEKVPQLAGHRIGIVTGNEATTDLLDVVLNHYGVPLGQGADFADRSEKPRRRGPYQSGRRGIRRRRGDRQGHYRRSRGGRAERRGADLHRNRSGGRHRASAIPLSTRSISMPAPSAAIRPLRTTASRA